METVKDWLAFNFGEIEVGKHRVSKTVKETRKELFETIRSFFPDYNLRANVVQFENAEISRECSVRTQITNLENDTANITFTLNLMVPLLYNEDISYSVNEENFWELLDVIYSKNDFTFYEVDSITNANLVDHESGKGSIYQCDINGKIILKIENCE